MVSGLQGYGRLSVHPEPHHEGCSGAALNPSSPDWGALPRLVVNLKGPPKGLDVEAVPSVPGVNAPPLRTHQREGISALLY